MRQDPGPAQRQHLTGHPCLERLAHFFPLLVFVEKGGGCRNPIGPVVVMSTPDAYARAGWMACVLEFQS